MARRTVALAAGRPANRSPGPAARRAVRNLPRRGYDAVDGDTLDGHQNPTGFPLTAADQLRFNTWFANTVHGMGMAAILKNDSDQASELEPYFDAAISERCVEDRFCRRWWPFIRAASRSSNVEYARDPSPPCANIRSMRWDGQIVGNESQPALPGIEDQAVVRTFDAPEAMGVRFHEVRCRSALNHVPSQSRVPFEWTVNPYRGCTHACQFCFARPTHEYLDFNAGSDFEKEIVVKVNVPEVLRGELGKRTWKREQVALGTNTDPYQWVEGRYRLMRGIWEAFRDFANPCSVLTKSPLLLRDVPLMEEVAERAPVKAALSVPTLDGWRATEPHTPSPWARLEAVAKLNEAGIPTGVLIAPIMPGINDSPARVGEIARRAREAGATHVTGLGLHLRGAVRGLFFDWLREERPDLLPRYEDLYRRGAYLPAAERKRIAGVVALARRGLAAVPSGGGAMRR